MPHVPNRPPGVQPPADSHPAIPLRDGGKDTRNPLARSLSTRSYQPDRALLHRTLLGREPVVDPYTGELVIPVQPANEFWAKPPGP